MSVPKETQRRLLAWGYWAGSGLIGFPMLCALTRIGAGSRATSDGQTDPAILRTDEIIARAELPMRRILIRHYCTHGVVREKAGRMGMAKSTYYDRLEEARWYVHTEYDKPDVALPDSRCDIRASVGSYPR